MKKTHPRLWAVERIHHILRHQLTSRDQLRHGLMDLAHYQHAMEQVEAKIGRCRSRGWHLAAELLRADLFPYVQCLQEVCVRLLAQESRPTIQVPSLGHLMAELRQLHEEFGGLQIDIDAEILSVQTEPIDLEGIHLGPFAIELHLETLTTRQNSECFHCVAVEPNPASSNEEVTHPHVQDEMLCAGDASAPIASALRQGRLADAFCLIRSVLQTYNPSSPYVSLGQWNGSRCRDCDRLTDDDDRRTCERCDRELCDECMSHCQGCEESCCTGCLDADEDTNELYCSHCRDLCEGCNRMIAKDRLDDESGLCPRCLQAQNEHENQADMQGAARGTAPDPV